MVICCVAATRPVLTYGPSTLRSGARGALHLTHSWTGSFLKTAGHVVSYVERSYGRIEKNGRRCADRARLDGRDAGPRGGALRRPNPARGGKLSDQRPALAAQFHHGLESGQMGRGAGQPRSGPPARGQGRR